jgi:predicted DNA-binding antitoxin AbrB/MazE fold protein
MTITIRAVYESGVLRPLEPLPLSEGESVDVTIAQARLAGSQPRNPTSAEADYAQRIKAARSLEEMYAIMASAPLLPEGYDLCEALNLNRRATGERMLYPEAKDGGG